MHNRIPLILALLLSTLLLFAANALAGGPVISIDFTKNHPMAPGEKAGVEEAANWNSATDQAGTLSPLVDSEGKKVEAGVEWAGGQASWSNSEIQDEPGNARMMKDYLDCNPQTPTTVTLAGLGKVFGGKSYDLIVYTDGQNGGAARVTEFQIGDQILCAKDNGSSSFHGDYEEAPPASTGEEAQFGNFVRFRKSTKDSVTLEVRAGLSKDPWPRGPLCGIQIVPAQN